MGSPPILASAAPSRAVSLDTLIANLAPIRQPPIKEPPRARTTNPRGLHRFRPVLRPIAVEPGMASMQKFERALAREVAAPLNIALEPAGYRKSPLRPIKLVGKRCKTTPRPAQQPAQQMDAANLESPAAPGEAHDQETRDSSEGALPAKSAVAYPTNKSAKQKQLPAKLKTQGLRTVFAALSQRLTGVGRGGVAAAVAVIAVVGLGLLFSTNSAFLTAAQESIAPRAAILMEDDFGAGGREGWDAPNSLVANEAGGVRVEGLMLHTETMQLADYRMDFEASLSSGSVAWVIDAKDSQNYHLYKLEKAPPQSEKPYQVVHYPVVNGEADITEAVAKEVPQELNDQVFHRFSVRVREGRIFTFVNGESVDYWTPDERPIGGIGFFGSKDEPSVIGYVTTYSNQDFLGFSLAIALDANKSFQGYLDSPA